MYFILDSMFSPLKPTKQNIHTGRAKIIQKEITNCIELKSNLKIKKVNTHHIKQKIADE